AHFARLGLPKGAQIGCVLRNKPLPCGAMLGIVALDDCVVTFNGLLPDEKLADDIRKANAPVVVASAVDWDRTEFVEAVRAIGAAGLLLTGDLSNPVESVPGLESLGTREHAPPLPEVAILMLTSGTTGKPKRVPLKASVLERQLTEAAGGQRHSPGEQGAAPSTPAAAGAVSAMTGSVVHIGGVWGLFGAVMAGRAIALYDKFTVEAWRQSVEEFRPKTSGAPPAALRMILDANLPKETFSSLLSLGAGTAALDPAIVDEFLKRYDLPVLSNYGATEFAGGVASWSLKAFRQYWTTKRGAVGRVHHGVEARIVDPDTDQVLPFGAEGLLELKGFQVGDGESWVRTTDRGVLDEDRFLWIRGRADNAINRGGFKVHPDEVVAVLEQHPSVREASVVGVPDRRLGLVPVAAVILRAGAARPSDAELANWVRGKLMAYCVPVAFMVVDDLPRTPSMKVSTPAVRELFAERSG
ncbi:MAG TPA: long-chain fatty acid--CoA ligase, partial [Caulobacteraceae bacterium]|nr:long-chain fatty acid--CoA ligase [Caulobacteraceae bacterium]